MDELLDDILSEVKAPARSKFQPKAKPRPKKGSSVSVPVAVVSSKELPVIPAVFDSVSSQHVQPGDIVDKNLDAKGSAGLKQTSFSKHTCNLEKDLIDGNFSVEVQDAVGNTIIGLSENFISMSSGQGQLSADTVSGLKSPEDTMGQSSGATNCSAEMPMVDASSIQIKEQLSVIPDVGFTEGCPLGPCSAQTSDALSVPLMDHDTEHYKEGLVSDAGDFLIIEQVAVNFSCHEDADITNEADTASGKRAVKFQPKPKVQNSGKKDAANVPDASTAAPENQHMKAGGSIEAGECDSVFDLSHSWMESPVVEESGKHGIHNVTGALNFTHNSLNKGPALSGVEENDNEYVFLDDANGDHYDGSSGAKVPDEPTIGKNENNVNNCLGEDTSKKKKQKKVKKDASDNDKSVRKKRKEPKAPDGFTEKPPKKFPHATRRKRCVDKSLLDAPEHEIDLQRVPIRDLIMLAEYKERQTKKNSTAVQPPTVNERGDYISENFLHNDDETFGSDQDTGCMDNPSTSRVIKDASHFHYGSHTVRNKVKWSKQDTELFYQGVRQFGTDLSLIAELFPGWDRKVIKLKYKKEERQHPMRLNDALSSRENDHSQFELVIQRLQERAAAVELQAKQDQMFDEDNSVNPTGEEETNETAGKSEQNEDGSAADQTPDKAQVASPAKVYDGKGGIEFPFNDNESIEDGSDYSDYQGVL